MLWCKTNRRSGREGGWWGRGLLAGAGCVLVRGAFWRGERGRSWVNGAYRSVIVFPRFLSTGSPASVKPTRISRAAISGRMGAMSASRVRRPRSMH